MSDLVSRVEEKISPVIPKAYELIDIEWEKVGKDFILSILIDKPGGIKIEETTILSELISPLLDEINPDPFPSEGYLLEVASPGAERPLKTPQAFKDNIDEQILITLYQKLEGKKEFIGQIVAADESTVQVDYFEKTKKASIEIPYTAIAKAQTLVKF